MAGTYGFAKSFPVFRLVLRDCHALLRKARNDKPESLFIQKTQKARSRSSSLFCIQLNRFRFTALRSRYQCPPVW